MPAVVPSSLHQFDTTTIIVTAWFAGPGWKFCRLEFPDNTVTFSRDRSQDYWVAFYILFGVSPTFLKSAEALRFTRISERWVSDVCTVMKAIQLPNGLKTCDNTRRESLLAKGKVPAGATPAAVIGVESGRSDVFWASEGNDAATRYAYRQ